MYKTILIFAVLTLIYSCSDNSTNAGGGAKNHYDGTYFVTMTNGSDKEIFIDAEYNYVKWGSIKFSGEWEKHVSSRFNGTSTGNPSARIEIDFNMNGCNGTIEQLYNSTLTESTFDAEKLD